jgi:ActR/RegA family two-component response regulator
VLRIWSTALAARYWDVMATSDTEPDATHILLIEDDPAIGESLVDALEANGFRRDLAHHLNHPPVPSRIRDTKRTVRLTAV